MHVKGRFLCALLGAAGSVVGLSVASVQTMFADAPFGEHASLRDQGDAARTKGMAGRSSKARFERVRYFRLLARPFAARTCDEFREPRWRRPSRCTTTRASPVASPLSDGLAQSPSAKNPRCALAQMRATTNVSWPSVAIVTGLLPSCAVASCPAPAITLWRSLMAT